MSGHSLQDAAKALAAALAGRLDLRDSDHSGTAVDQALRARVLSSYAQELSGLAPEASGRWLLERLATLESRLIAVQSARWHGEAPAAPTPPAPPPVAPVVADEVVLPRRILMTCDESLIGEGFYPLERSGEGTPFYWLGPAPRATVLLPKLAAPVEVRLRLHAAFVPEVLPEIRLSLDGGAWTPVRVEEEAGRVTLVAAPPPGEAARPASMRLGIDAVRTESPASKGEADSRQLGIALERIDLSTIGPAGG